MNKHGVKKIYVTVNRIKLLEETQYLLPVNTITIRKTSKSE